MTCTGKKRTVSRYSITIPETSRGHCLLLTGMHNVLYCSTAYRYVVPCDTSTVPVFLAIVAKAATDRTVCTVRTGTASSTPSYVQYILYFSRESQKYANAKCQIVVQYCAIRTCTYCTYTAKLSHWLLAVFHHCTPVIVSQVRVLYSICTHSTVQYSTTAQESTVQWAYCTVQELTTVDSGPYKL